MTIFCILALWAYLMTALSNPGFVDPKLLSKFNKTDLNKKLTEMMGRTKKVYKKNQEIDFFTNEGGEIANPLADGNKDID